MASLVDISYSTEEDVEILAAIPPAAMAHDLVGRALFKGSEDSSGSVKWMASIIQKGLENTNCHVFKATLKGSGEIVGHAIVRFEQGLPSESPPEGGEPPSMPPFFNADFAKTLFGGLSAKYKQHMEGRKHVVWGSLYVKPGFQRKGIGEAMLTWGFATLGLDKHEIWLTTQMLGRKFYRKFGWQDVDAVDMDLSEYLGELRGYGVHRTACLVRKPGTWET